MSNTTIETITWIGIIAATLHLFITFIIAMRVLTRRRPPGSATAWLLMIVMLPYVGVLLYLLIGERPLGKRRAMRVQAFREPVEQWLYDLAQRMTDPPPDVIAYWSRVRYLADRTVGIPALAGNRLELLADTEQILRSIIADIEHAEHFCLLEFYIWNPGGTADAVAEALIHAAQRNVICQVLLDDVGSADFFRSPWPQRLRVAGVEVHCALPASIVRAMFRRVDLRLHRKLVVVDGQIAYTGSLNLVDPRFFKKEAGVGQWVDAMTRIRGPVVEALAGLFAWDWALETGAPLDRVIRQIEVLPDESAGQAVVQMTPSGPSYEGHNIIQLLLSAIYGAREELILTTPYFIPDESLVVALQTAALRGVKVQLILPARVDSFLVRQASRAFYDDLLEAGVEILLFNGGLLHTKSVLVDRELVFFGTLNLDIRSFLLNFEVTLIVYDTGFAAELSALTHRYMEDSEILTLTAWGQRPQTQRLTENLIQLTSPLL